MEITNFNTRISSRIIPNYTIFKYEIQMQMTVVLQVF